MSLPYPTLDSVKTRQISLNDINSMTRKLIENDESMSLGLDDLPIIWECKWYNDDGIAGYPFGTKVWVNTEDPVQFVNGKFDDITNYILNSDLLPIYRDISATPQKLNQFYLSVVQNSVGTHKTPLYYLGTLTAKTEVRVLTATDANGGTTGYCKQPPSNTTYWVNALSLSSKQNYSDWMDKAYLSCYQKNLSSHIEEYHLTSMVPSQLSNEYLLSDFSNLDTYQRLTTHNKRIRLKEVNAFDCIQRFVAKRISSSDKRQCRWFRLWKSGYLEHGGTIPFDASTGQVSLTGWTYAGGKIPPKFDYPLDFQSMYATGTTIKKKTSATPVQPSGESYGPEYTYNLEVSLVDNIANGQLVNRSVDTYDIQPDGFKVDVSSGQTGLISYYASGFILQTSIRKYI